MTHRDNDSVEIYDVEDSESILTKRIGVLDTSKNRLVKWSPHRDQLKRALQIGSPTLHALYLGSSEWHGSTDWQSSQGGLSISFFELVKDLHSHDHAGWKVGLARSWICDWIFRNIFSAELYKPFKFVTILYTFLSGWDTFFSSANGIVENFVAKEDTLVHHCHLQREDLWLLLILHYMKEHAKSFYHSKILGNTSVLMTRELFAHHLLSLLGSITKKEWESMSLLMALEGKPTFLYKWNVDDLTTLAFIVFMTIDVYENGTESDILNNYLTAHSNIVETSLLKKDLDPDEYMLFHLSIYDATRLADALSMLAVLRPTGPIMVPAPPQPLILVRSWTPIVDVLLKDLSNLYQQTQKEELQLKDPTVNFFHYIKDDKLQCTIPADVITLALTIPSGSQFPEWESLDLNATDFEEGYQIPLGTSGPSSAQSRPKKLLFLNTKQSRALLQDYVAHTRSSGGPLPCDISLNLIISLYAVASTYLLPDLTIVELRVELVKIWLAIDQLNLTMRLGRYIEDRKRRGVFVYHDYSDYVLYVREQTQKLFDSYKDKFPELNGTSFQTLFTNALPGHQVIWYSPSLATKIVWDWQRDPGADLVDIYMHARLQWRWNMGYLWRLKIREHPRLKRLPEWIIAKVEAFTLRQLEDNLIQLSVELHRYLTSRIEQISQVSLQTVGNVSATTMMPDIKMLYKLISNTPLCRTDGLNALMFVPWAKHLEVSDHITSNIKLMDETLTAASLGIQSLVNSQILPFYYLLAIQNMCEDLHVDGVLIQTFQKGFDQVILINRTTSTLTKPVSFTPRRSKKKRVMAKVHPTIEAKFNLTSTTSLIDTYKTVVTKQIRYLLTSIRERRILITNNIPHELFMYD